MESVVPSEHVLTLFFMSILLTRLRLFALIVLQLLMTDFSFDSIDVSVQQTTNAAGIDYMTDWENWLNIQVRNVQSVIDCQ